jgi:signal transduction histidine kinase
VVAATRQLVGKPPIATLRPTDKDVRTQRTLCPPAGLKGCMTVVSFKIYSRPEGVWLIDVAVPWVPWYGNSTALFLAIGVSLLITAMMAVGVFRAVGKALAPVDAIRTELAEITATGLHRRVPVPSNQAEIKLLAETANATLDRLEGAYQQLQQFTSDASHDLRSPITAMRTQVEEALLAPEETDWTAVSDAILESLDRLQALVTDLLMIASLDAGAKQAHDIIDLSDLVKAELDRRPQPVKVVERLEPGVVVIGDLLRLTRLFTNLLDNAVRHATDATAVHVATTLDDEGTVTVRVSDDGGGIPAHLVERVFLPHERGGATAPGAGLGLAIARGIVDAHGGTIRLEPSARGTTVAVTLPIEPVTADA